MKAINKLKEIYRDIRSMRKDLNYMKMALGRIEGRQLGTLANTVEYKVFSQWGEDGIIQWIVNNINISEKRFIEFGVENYIESNTRYLLMNDNWSGLIIDGSEENIDFIKKDEIYWRYNLKAVEAFITAENINELILKNFGKRSCGILSIDIDGNDYWVWKAIDSITPDIAILEYNYRFGQEKSVTIPYNPHFYRGDAHYSMIYYGASIGALVKLGNEKGYSLVAGNKNGNNIFFVRNDLLNHIVKKVEISDAFQEGKFRESRDKNGNLIFLSKEEEFDILMKLPLIEI